MYTFMYVICLKCSHLKLIAYRQHCNSPSRHLPVLPNVSHVLAMPMVTLLSVSLKHMYGAAYIEVSQPR